MRVALGLFSLTNDGEWVCHVRTETEHLEVMVGGTPDQADPEAIERAHGVFEQLERLRPASLEAVREHALGLGLEATARSPGWELIGIECPRLVQSFNLIWVEPVNDISGWWEVCCSGRSVLQVRRLVQ
jgi:hypothetical protein